MGKKVDTKQRPSNDGRDDLDIMHPDMDVTIAGRRILVREYGFVQGMQLRRLADPITRGLEQQVQTGETLFDDVLMVLGEHIDIARQLVAASAEVELEWITGLSDVDGDLLLQVWWRVNERFFTRIVTRRLAERARVKLAVLAAAGATSMPASPQKDSATLTASADTPNGS